MGRKGRKTAVVFGGSSGIGEATAAALQGAGERVVIVGRGAGRLAEAAARLGGVETAALDARDGTACAALFERVGAVDHVVICVSGGKGAGPFASLNLGELRAAFDEKLFAQLSVAQVAARHIREEGSITFVSAASASSVIRGTAGLAAVNGALEAMVSIVAHELAPIRVNAVSPGIVDTPWWRRIPRDAREGVFESAARTLPVRRVGNPEEVGAFIAMVARNGFVTGSVHTIDGGGHLVTQ